MDSFPSTLQMRCDVLAREANVQNGFTIQYDVYVNISIQSDCKPLECPV